MELYKENFGSKNQLAEYMEKKLEYLVTSRPTAVNMKTAATELNSLAKSLCNNENIQTEQMKLT